jgi:toxin ParE1/3/4
MPGKQYEVLLTQGAEQDLESIYDHIAAFDSPVNADQVLDQMLEVAQRPATFPGRGSHPRELLALSIHDYRQVTFKPYRVIYRVIGSKVYVTLIADGRRDMQSLLARRLLGGVARGAVSGQVWVSARSGGGCDATRVAAGGVVDGVFTVAAEKLPTLRRSRHDEPHL